MKKKLIAGILSLVAVVSASVPGLAKEEDYINSTYFIPEGLGSLHTYTIWDGIKWGGDCRTLINYLGDRISDSYGIVTYGDAFAGATTSTFGNVGDILLVLNRNSCVYPVCIADEKCQTYTAWDSNPANMWGHHNGQCIVEFEIIGSCRGQLYNGTGGYIGEAMNDDIYKIINLGSVYDDPSLLDGNVLREKAKDAGLGGYKMLTTPWDGYII